jgi:hypothetical protein
MQLIRQGRFSTLLFRLVLAVKLKKEDSMANYVNVTLRNATSAQHIYHATDDVLHQEVLPNTPLASGETTPIQLVADENGHGRMTYGYLGGINTSRDDLNDGDPVDG